MSFIAQNYKACFIIFFFAIVSSFDLKAQDKNFQAGVLFNANGIQISGQDVAYWSASQGEIWGTGGLSFGGFIKRKFSDQIFASLELRYIRKGSIYEYLAENSIVSYEVLKLNYLELPLLFGYTFRPNGKYRIFETGLAVSHMFSSELELNELSYRKGSPEVSDFKKIDISWVVSIKFPLNRRKGDNLLFGLRMEHSIFTIHEYYKLYNFVYGIQLDFRI